MPEFPRYFSKGKLDANLPAVPSPVDSSAKGIAAAGQVGDVLADSAKIWLRASDTIQKTISGNSYTAAKDDILARREQDPDPNNAAKYYDELDKAQKESLEGFSSKLAETEMTTELNLQTRIGQIQIDAITKNHFIDAGRAAAFGKLDKLVQNLPEDWEKQLADEVELQKSALVFNNVEAYNLTQKYLETGRYNRFLTDFRDDPIAAEKKFSESGYGMNLETAEKARSKLKELKTIQRENEGELYSEMSLRIMTGDLNESEIDAAMAVNEANPNSGISKAHGNQLRTALYRDITARIGTKQFKKYRQALDFIFADSAQDKIKGYEAILEAYENGITKDEAGYLSKILKAKKDVTFANKAAAGKKILEQLFGARVKDVGQETRSLLDYARRIAGDAIPEEAAQQTALDLIQRDHPATVLDPELAATFSPTKGIRAIPKVKQE